MNNNDVLKKIATNDFSGGGILNPAQAKKFFTMTIDESVLKNSVRTILMAEPIMEIDKLSVGSRVARPKGEMTAPASGDYVAVTTDKIELSTKAIVVPWEVSYETFEDNIEGEGFENTLLEKSQHSWRMTLKNCIFQETQVQATRILHFSMVG